MFFGRKIAKLKLLASKNGILGKGQGQGRFLNIPYMKYC